MITIRVGQARATFDGVAWRSLDENLARALEALTPYDQKSPSIPRFDVFAAEHVIGKFDNAAILDVSPLPKVDDAGVLY